MPLPLSVVPLGQSFSASSGQDLFPLSTTGGKQAPVERRCVLSIRRGWCEGI